VSGAVRRLGIGASLAALGAASALAGPPQQVSREAMEALELQLEQAVGQVSRPAPGIVLGRVESARGYYLPGYGAVIVLTPRALPRPGNAFLVHRRSGPGGTARVQIETRVEGTGADQQNAERLAEHARQVLGMSGGAERRPAAAGSTGRPESEIDELIALEQQVLEFQRLAEESRLSAEQEFERLTQNVRVRFGAPPEEGAAGPGAAPVAAADGAPPSKGAVTTASTPAPRAGGRLATGAPGAPRPADAARIAPWRFWFEAGGPPDPRPPDRVAADVRDAVIATVENAGTRLTGLQGEECVAVAVDFVVRGVFVSDPRPSRTMVIRARKRDLDARRAGALSPEDLRHRIEVIEY
jgi:hypothetical protein